jgi:hypothetical protein
MDFVRKADGAVGRERRKSLRAHQLRGLFQRLADRAEFGSDRAQKIAGAQDEVRCCFRLEHPDPSPLLLGRPGELLCRCDEGPALFEHLINRLRQKLLSQPDAMRAEVSGGA